jgi:hypothetical protein
MIKGFRETVNFEKGQGAFPGRILSFCAKRSICGGGLEAWGRVRKVYR